MQAVLVAPTAPGSGSMLCASQPAAGPEPDTSARRLAAGASAATSKAAAPSARRKRVAGRKITALCFNSGCTPRNKDDERHARREPAGMIRPAHEDPSEIWGRGELRSGRSKQIRRAAVLFRRKTHVCGASPVRLRAARSRHADVTAPIENYRFFRSCRRHGENRETAGRNPAPPRNRSRFFLRKVPKTRWVDPRLASRPAWWVSAGPSGSSTNSLHQSGEPRTGGRPMLDPLL
jgi:hypothetical protein